MATSVSAAPSWQETTLQWITENCPQYLGARGTPANKLIAALRKASYMLASAGHVRAKHQQLLAELVPRWNSVAHNDFRHWIDTGGYTAPAHIPAPAATPGKAPPVVIMTPDGPEAIQIEQEDEDLINGLQPPAQHTQTLEEAVAEEELQRDERYGAW